MVHKGTTAFWKRPAFNHHLQMGFKQNRVRTPTERQTFNLCQGIGHYII